MKKAALMILVAALLALLILVWVYGPDAPIEDWLGCTLDQSGCRVVALTYSAIAGPLWQVEAAMTWVIPRFAAVYEDGSWTVLGWSGCLPGRICND